MAVVYGSLRIVAISAKALNWKAERQWSRGEENEKAEVAVHSQYDEERLEQAGTINILKASARKELKVPRPLL
jgi:hypothetical protein